METTRFGKILDELKLFIEKIKLLIKDVMAFIENPYVADESSTAAN